MYLDKRSLYSVNNTKVEGDVTLLGRWLGSVLVDLASLDHRY